MTMISTQRSAEHLWKINSVEVNSEPTSSNEFKSVVIDGSEIRIEPAGISLTAQEASKEGILFKRGSELYLGKVSQNKSHLVIALQRPLKQERVLIKATRQVASWPGHDDFIVTPESATIQ